jgi:Uma2 family endonuclease
MIAAWLKKKRLYAALGIPEYWVVDIQGERVLAFRLQENGKYWELHKFLRDKIRGRLITLGSI